MNKKNFIYILFGFILAATLAACRLNATPTVVPGRHTFTLEIKGEDGTQVTWEGYADGYQPGVTEPMQLAVQNNSEQPWFGRICFSLLMPYPSGVYLPLAEREFTLAAGEGFEDTVNFELPPDHPDGIYGLSMVVHRPTGPTVNVTPIQIGEVGDGWPTDSWLSDAALEACQ